MWIFSGLLDKMEINANITCKERKTPMKLSKCALKEPRGTAWVKMSKHTWVIGTKGMPWEHLEIHTRKASTAKAKVST